MEDKEKNLCSFSRMKEIIEKINPENIISYEGTAGTSQQTGVSPYQVIEMRIAFYGEDGDKTDWWRNNPILRGY